MANRSYIITSQPGPASIRMMRRVEAEGISGGEKIITPADVARMMLEFSGEASLVVESSPRAILRWLLLSNPKTIVDEKLGEFSAMPGAAPSLAEAIERLEKAGLCPSDLKNAPVASRDAFAVAKRSTLLKAWEAVLTKRHDLGIVPSSALFAAALPLVEKFPFDNNGVWRFEDIFDPGWEEKRFLDAVAGKIDENPKYFVPMGLDSDFSQVEVYSIGIAEEQVTAVLSRVATDLSSGVNANRVSIVLPSVDLIPSLTTMAERIGIPLAINCSVPIAWSACGHAVNAFCNILSGNVTLSTFKELIQTSRLWKSDGDDFVSKKRLLKTLSKQRCTKEYEDWLARLDVALNESLEDYEKEIFGQFKHGLEKIVSYSNRFKEASTLGDVRAILVDFLTFHAKLDGYSAFKTDLDGAAQFDKLPCDYERALSFWIDFIETLTYIPRDTKKFGVIVETLASSASDSDSVYCCGFNAGSVPPKGRELPFLLDCEIESIKKIHKGRPLHDSMSITERLDFAVKRRLTPAGRVTVFVPRHSYGSSGTLAQSPLVSLLGVPMGESRAGRPPLLPSSKDDLKITADTYGYRNIRNEVEQATLTRFGFSEGRIGESLLEYFEATAVSGIKNCAQCPYKFFMNRVLGAKTTAFVEPDQKWPSALLGGSIYHGALEFCMNKGKKKAPTEKDLNLAIGKIVDTLSLDEPPPNPRMRDQYITQVKADVLRYVESQFKQLGEQNREILDQELPFGLLPRDKSSRGYSRDADVEITFGGLSLKMHGFIDRIDVRPKEGDPAVLLARIIDYKTGAPANWWSAKERNANHLSDNVVQLALYALALEQVTASDKVRLEVEAIELHSPQAKHKFKTLAVSEFGNPGSPERQIFEKLLAEYIQSLREIAEKGVMPRHIDSRRCQYCDFESCCPNTPLLNTLQGYKANSDPDSFPYFNIHGQDILNRSDSVPSSDDELVTTETEEEVVTVKTKSKKIKG